jgi:hypothetical protein
MAVTPLTLITPCLSMSLTSLFRESSQGHVLISFSQNANSAYKTFVERSG